MEKTKDDAGSAEQQQNETWLPTDFVKKIESVSLGQRNDSLRNRVPNDDEYNGLSCQAASQILWSTGMLREPIPNGFYSVAPDRRLKELFEDLPSLDQLQALGIEGITGDIILVDSEKDKKISMLKQLIVTLVKGLNSTPAAMIKKVAGLACDFYKRPNSELSSAKAALDETSLESDSRGVQLLGQIKHSSCRPRAILFKVLADTVGLESRLVVGLPTEGVSESVESYKHMSVFVMLNSVEMLVDLKRFPGQLIPRSTKAIFMTHISAGESDNAENDSCDSPLEPSSPLYGTEKDDGLHYHRRLEASSNVAGPSLRNRMLRSSTFVNRKLSPSHSEPDIASNFWRRSRRKANNEPRTASSSPEHPSFRARGRSMLSVDNTSLRDSSVDVASTRSSGALTLDTRRIRRRSISITPEIGDDIVRAVRAMNETLKQDRLMREGDNISHLDTSSVRSVASEYQNNLDDHDEVSGEKTSMYIVPREQLASERAVSLPSSPNQYSSQTADNSVISRFKVNEEDMVSTWNSVLRSHVFQNNLLLPFDEWNIEFSEFSVGIRVGIGFFGEVFRGIWNGTDVAIKVFLEQDLTAENMMDFCNEISILSRLRHPNVILFLGACTKPPRLSMITEYMEMGSLYHLVHVSGQKVKLSWRRRLKMLRDICRGLMCIHRMKIVHRDIKSANCLVNKHWTVKICDFGLSRIMTESPIRDSSSAGTPEWMAPELIRSEPFTEKCDIFSLGVIMWELCTLNKPWEGVPPQRVVYAVAHEGSRLEIPEGPLGRLIADCWAEPHERPSCGDILKRLLDCENYLC